MSNIRFKFLQVLSFLLLLLCCSSFAFDDNRQTRSSQNSAAVFVHTKRKSAVRRSITCAGVLAMR